MLSTTQLGPRVLVWLRFACQCCASMLRVVLSAHEVIMPHGHQGQPGVTPRHPLVGGLTPHTVHNYSFGPLQAITIVSHSDPDSQTLAPPIQVKIRILRACAGSPIYPKYFRAPQVSPSVAARVARGPPLCRLFCVLCPTLLYRLPGHLFAKSEKYKKDESYAFG